MDLWNTETETDADEILHFHTSSDIAPRMSGHLDRFATDSGLKTAHRAIWGAAKYNPRTGTYTISKSHADKIMDEHVEREGAE